VVVSNRFNERGDYEDWRLTNTFPSWYLTSASGGLRPSENLSNFDRQLPNIDTYKRTLEACEKNHELEFSKQYKVEMGKGVDAGFLSLSFPNPIDKIFPGTSPYSHFFSLPR